MNMVDMIVNEFRSLYNRVYVPMPRREVMLGTLMGATIGAMVIYDVGGVRSLYYRDVVSDGFSKKEVLHAFIVLWIIAFTADRFRLEWARFLTTIIGISNIVIVLYFVSVWLKTHLGF